MKSLSLIIALLLSAIALTMEFQTSSHSGLWGDSQYLLKLILIIVLVVVGFWGKLYWGRVLIAICFLVTSISIGHSLYIDRMYSSKSAFKAYSYGKEEGRESVELDFKENGCLRVHAIYKFNDDYFLGSYKRVGDTLFLHVKTDFIMGRKAVLQDHKLVFPGSHSVYKYYEIRF